MPGESGTAAGATGSSAGDSPPDGASARPSVNSEIRLAALYIEPAPEPGGKEGVIDVPVAIGATRVAGAADGGTVGGIGPGAAGVFAPWEE